MDTKAVSSVFIRACAVMLAVLCVTASKVSAKSLSTSGGTSVPSCMTPLSMSTLYPSTTTLALHPMHDAPFQDGSVPPASPCPGSGATFTSYDPINKKATCPFEYFTNYDRQRVPAIIEEARCLCGGCLDAYTGHEAPDLTCQEIRYPMKVLRKNLVSPVNGFEMYSQTTELITVGCTCSRLV